MAAASGDRSSLPPPDLLCPITKKLLKDPVILLESGHTYDSKAIQGWLNLTGPKRDPLTADEPSPLPVLRRSPASIAASDVTVQSSWRIPAAAKPAQGSSLGSIFQAVHASAERMEARQQSPQQRRLAAVAKAQQLGQELLRQGQLRQQAELAAQADATAEATTQQLLASAAAAASAAAQAAGVGRARRTAAAGDAVCVRDQGERVAADSTVRVTAAAAKPADMLQGAAAQSIAASSAEPASGSYTASSLAATQASVSPGLDAHSLVPPPQQQQWEHAAVAHSAGSAQRQHNEQVMSAQQHGTGST
ncbi:hypothetical protein COO60DRAFT_1462837, partial [Scenedesmus sp. NREL 46B-D3]